MQPYFVDTSAIIKRYVRWEVGHQWMNDILAPERSNVFYREGAQSPVFQAGDETARRRSDRVPGA
jgi:hypothetical protein